MGNTYMRKRAVLCYPCDLKELPGVATSSDASVASDVVLPEDFLSSEYLDFHFVHDLDTVNFVKKNKVLFVLRGLPGSGKSFITRVLLSIYPNSVAFTADTYLLRHPDLILNYEVLDDAHRHCLNAVVRVVRVGQSPVIVDNTNVTRKETKQYLRLAKVFGYFGLVIEPRTPWRFTPTALTNKTNKKVVLAVVQNRLNAWQDLFPVSYACFLNSGDTKTVLDLVEQLLERVFLWNVVKDDFSAHKGEEVVPQAAIASYMKHKGTEHAMLKWVVKKGTDLTPDGFYSIGKAVDFKITAFLMTPREIGAKISPSAVKILSEDPSKEVKTEYGVMSVLSGSSWEMAVENMQPLAELESLHASNSLPGSVQDVSTGIKIVRLGHCSFAFYAGRELAFRGLFSGSYL